MHRQPAAAPGSVAIARADREFLACVVRFLVDAGVHQFLDIGTGLPTANTTHHVAQERVPESRIVYVDDDLLVLVHARALRPRCVPEDRAHRRDDHSERVQAELDRFAVALGVPLRRTMDTYDFADPRMATA